MTAPAIDTTVLEHLDRVIPCQGNIHTDTPPRATHRMDWHGCYEVAACLDCTQVELRYWAELIAGGQSLVYCKRCLLTPRSVGDVITVVPL